MVPFQDLSPSRSKKPPAPRWRHPAIQTAARAGSCPGSMRSLHGSRPGCPRSGPAPTRWQGNGGGRGFWPRAPIPGCIGRVALEVIGRTTVGNRLQRSDGFRHVIGATRMLDPLGSPLGRAFGRFWIDRPFVAAVRNPALSQNPRVRNRAFRSWPKASMARFRAKNIP